MEYMDLTELKQQLLDAIADNPSAAFPTFNWQPNTRNVSRYGVWTSSVHVNGNDSSDHNPRQTYIKDGQTEKHAIIADENGDSVEILKLWEQEHGERFPNCPDLFSLYHIDAPQRDPEQATREQKRKTDTEELLSDIRADYLGQAGEQVREYLSNVRGWTQDTINAMADYIGVITPTTACRLATLSGLPIPSDVGDKFPLVILTIAKRGGAIQYAKFRTIKPDAAKTEKWHNPTKGTTGVGRDDVDPYNYNRTSFLKDTNARHVVVVESEICAAHATVAGIKNVIALRGSDGIKQPLARRLVADHCERIILLMDNDAKGKSATIKTIREIRRYAPKLEISVATIPTEYNAKDPDELLTAHPDDGGAILQGIIDNAPTANQWNAERYRTAAEPEREQILVDVLNECSELRAAGQYIKADTIGNEFCTLSGATFTPDALKAQAQEQAKERAMELYKKREQQALADFDAARAANDKKGFRDALETLSELREPTDDKELHAGGTFEQVAAELYRDAALDIRTNYGLYTKRPNGTPCRIPLKLYANGITYFAGGTSHGKSTILQNIALDLLEQQKTVLYYGFEETKRDTLLEFVNIFVHRHTRNEFADLSDDGSTDAINKYFGSADDAVFDTLTDAQRKRVAECIRGFFNYYRGMDGGKQTLFVYDDGLTSAELVAHIQEKAAQIQPDAVFVDYIQFLTSEGENPKAAQWEDLGRVSKDLIRINKTLGVPVVVAAQLREKNNTKDNPFELGNTDIFGASSIAQGAAAVYIVGNATKYNEETTVDYFGEQIRFGQSGQMAVKLDKNRFGPCPAFALYQYDGAKRYIDYETLVNPDNARNNNDNDVF